MNGGGGTVKLSSQASIDKRKENCLICDKPKMHGIHLFQFLICTDCERDMINTSTNEWKYQIYIHRLKKVSPFPNSNETSLDDKNIQ